MKDPPTYYSISVERPAPAASLAGASQADIAVVGGGLAGLSTALELAERGYRVAVLEAERIGHGASGRNGGQVIAGIAAPQDKLESLVDRADARAIWDLSLAGVGLIRERIARYGIDCDWRDGHMEVADKPRQVRDLTDWQRQLQTLGYSGPRLIEREELAGILGTSRYLAALYDPNGGHLHPLRYTLGLAAAAQRAGVTIHEHSRVLAYATTGHGDILVRTDRGELRCHHLVLAGNALLGNVSPPLARKIIPIGTYMIATEPLGEAMARQLIGNDAAVSDMNWILDYFRRSADHRLLFGGRVSYGGLDVSRCGPATRRRMLRVFPQLAAARIEHAWGCWLDITLNRAPHFGRLAPNIWFLQGFSGHGVALTGIAGRLAAEAIAGSSERFDVFARIPHRNFRGGRQLRRPALMLAMLWYRVRDLM